MTAAVFTASLSLDLPMQGKARRVSNPPRRSLPVAESRFYRSDVVLYPSLRSRRPGYVACKVPQSLRLPSAEEPPF